MGKSWNQVGIYKIINIITGDFYVGQSLSLRARKSQHFSKLRKNKHSNQHLQNSFNNHGEEKFEFSVILYCEEFELTRYEDLIKNSNKDHCYNIRDCADSNKGLKHSKETKEKISKAITGQKRSNEARENMRKGQGRGEENAAFGKHLSDDTKEKLSNSLSGENNPMYGKHHTDETKQKMSENHPDSFGENNPWFGKHHSKETREKISKANSGENAPFFGKQHSKETKQKMSDTRKRYWENIKKEKE